MEKGIRVERYVHRGEEEVTVDHLTPAERERLACWLKQEYLNELFRGKGTFTPQKDA